jgi:hypothetical protein
MDRAVRPGGGLSAVIVRAEDAMPTNATDPPAVTRTREEPDDREPARQPPKPEEATPEVQLGEDPGTLGREDLDEP